MFSAEILDDVYFGVVCESFRPTSRAFLASVNPPLLAQAILLNATASFPAGRYEEVYLGVVYESPSFDSKVLLDMNAAFHEKIEDNYCIDIEHYRLQQVVMKISIGVNMSFRVEMSFRAEEIESLCIGAGHPNHRTRRPHLHPPLAHDPYHLR